MRKDVIGTHQKIATLVEEAKTIAHRGNDLLVGSRAVVENIGTQFHAFILHRVNQQVVVLLKNRLQALAGGRQPNSENGAHVVLKNQLLSLAGGDLRVGLGIANDGFNAATQQSPVFVDL